MGRTRRTHVGLSLCLLLLTMGCRDSAPGARARQQQQRGAAAVRTAWTKAVAGLQLQLQLPAGATPAGQPIPLELRLRNASRAPLRLYLVREEAFRFGQSTLTLTALRGKKARSVQPEPRPHGYVVTEKDFHLLPVGGRHVTQQALSTRGLSPGRYRLQWEVENRVTRWPGGRTTLDGPTRALFGGKPIPHIWVGSATLTTQIELR